MPDWLKHLGEAFSASNEPRMEAVIARQLFALSLGALVGVIYRATCGRGAAESRSFTGTLVLMCVMMGMMTSVIGDNFARAFGAMGALSIVRFRTVVEDTRDTAFVVLAVAMGMAAGAGHWVSPLVTLPLAAGVAIWFRNIDANAQSHGLQPVGGAAASEGIDCTLVVRLGLTQEADARVSGLLGQHAVSLKLLAISTVRQGAGIERTYALKLKGEESAAALVAALNMIDGVQGVEIRRG